MTNCPGLPGTERFSQDTEFAVLKLGKSWANWDESVVHFGNKRSRIVGGERREAGRQVRRNWNGRSWRKVSQIPHRNLTN